MSTELEKQIKSVAKIIDFLGLAQEGFDLSRYKEELKQKTLEGTLTIKDALFITLNEKGLKILEKSFVQDPNSEMLAKIFPSNTNIDVPGGGTLAVSPTPSSAIANWSNLVSKINTKTGQDEKEILNTPIQSYIREGVSQEFDMKGAKGGSSALRQGIFYARKQLGFSKEEKKIVRDTYLDDTTLRQELGGSKTYGQKRSQGRALATRSIRASDAPLITQAVKEGMSVITDADAKAAIMYNILIPHRTVQVSRLRINPERDAKGNILKDATDPYLDGDQIVVPQEGAKKGQKRYTSIKLTPFMQDFLGQVVENNPDRTYLFRDNNVDEDAFATKVNNALQLPGGVAEKTQAFVDAGKFTGPINTFGMLRKLSAMSTALYVPGSFGNLRYIMGHTNLKQVASETGIDQQQKIHYIGDVQEGRTDLEVMKLYEDNLQKDSGASSKRDFLRSAFNISEINLTDSFTEPATTETQGRDLAKNVLKQVEFETQLNNRPDLSFESKLWILGNFDTQEAFEAFEDQIEQAQKAVGSESVDSLDQIIQRKINPELKVDSSVQEVIKELEAPEAPSKPSVMPEPVVTSPESDFDFTDTPQEDIPQTAQDARRRASEFFDEEQQKRDFLSRMGKGFDDDDDDDDGIGFIPSFSDIQRFFRGMDIGKDVLKDILKTVDEQRKGRNIPAEEEPEIKDDKKRENKVKKWVKKNFGKVLRRTPLGLVGMTAFDAIAAEPNFLEREAQVSSDIVAAQPDEEGLNFLDSLEKEYSQRVDLESRQPTSGIMKDSGITELDTQSINQQQLDNIRFAKKDLQQQVADLFNEPM